MKKFIGCEYVLDQQGLISELKDADGRSWCFSYNDGAVVAFVDPQKRSWTFNGLQFTSNDCVDSKANPLSVSVEQSTAEVTVATSLGRTTYKTDGSSLVVVERVRNGELVKITYMEYPTRPYRAFVVIEERAGKRVVSLVQDADAKLHKFDHDAAGRLCGYIDVSNSPSVIWTAEYSSDSRPIKWRGRDRQNSTAFGEMVPALESVDLSGNRHYVRNDGMRIVISPSGAACASSSPPGGVVSGSASGLIFGNVPSSLV